MNEILVLGANGQLGHDLCKIFTQNKLSFTAWSRNEFDCATDNLQEKLANPAPKIIINCIATTNVDGCEDNPELAFSVNAAFTYRLASLCNSLKITLFHLSTDYVFDGTMNNPYTEETKPNPLSIYGLSKYAGEIAIQNYHEKYFIFRVSSLFGKAGASGKGGNFITTMQRLGKERDSVSVVADQITCPTATLDVARCISHFILHKITEYGIYNCVSSNSCSWFEFAQSIFVLSGLDSNKVQQATFAGYKFKAKRPQYGILATNKLAKYYKMPDWETSLAEYFK